MTNRRAPVLAGPEQPARVREPELQAQGAGRRIDGPLDRRRGRPCAGATVPSASDQLDRDPRARVRVADSVGAPRDAQVLGLADAGAEEDRVDLRDRRQQRALAAADEAARP